MIEVCAAMGLANLAGFEETVLTNRRNQDMYKRELAGVSGIHLLDYPPAERNSHHYVVVEVRNGSAASRDRLLAGLHAENILARKYFWPGCHRMQPYRSLFPHAGMMLQRTEEIADRVLVLPNGNLPADAVATIAEVVRHIATSAWA